MRRDDVRFLFGYDRWAMRRVLAAADAIDDEVWAGASIVGERGVGGLIVHVLGAHQRWRHGLSGSSLEPRPEQEPLPSPAAVRDAWEEEWTALDGWLERVTDSELAREENRVPVWQMLAHVVNHGTQHRSEAAVLLASAGRFPGELDMLLFSAERGRDW
jgi:uncharacterized damage-inducible protein DinB